MVKGGGLRSRDGGGLFTVEFEHGDDLCGGELADDGADGLESGVVGYEDGQVGQGFNGGVDIGRRECLGSGSGSVGYRSCGDCLW